VPGTKAAEAVLPRLADTLATVLAQRRQIAAEAEEILDAHPLAEVLTSLPGLGAGPPPERPSRSGTGPRAASGHLAAYTGPAPVTGRSGSSTRGEHPPRGGNKQLKRALFLSAFTALRAPVSRTHYDRKGTDGKRHNTALIRLARRRTDVLFAILRDRTLYQPRPARAA
jgi:transposase